VITYSRALSQAAEYLRQSEILVQISLEGEFQEGWYFCYQSKEFLDTGGFSAQLAGNGPFLIDRDSGELVVLGTARPLEEYLNEYVKQKRARMA
jgi:hypothetical protein